MTINLFTSNIDGVSLASNDDMYAFSQIVAQGGNVSKTVKLIEEDEKEKKD